MPLWPRRLPLVCPRLGSLRPRVTRAMGLFPNWKDLVAMSIALAIILWFAVGCAIVPAEPVVYGAPVYAPVPVYPGPVYVPGPIIVVPRGGHGHHGGHGGHRRE